mgnify:FL=1
MVKVFNKKSEYIINKYGLYLPNIKEFIVDYNKNFYPFQDISFIDQFLEWTKIEYDDQFIIPHDILYEYGLCENNSFNISRNFEKLNLKENIDYEIKKEKLERTYKNVYMLTPKTFKKYLLSSTAHKNQTKDITVYRDYYLMLEECINYFNLHQKYITDEVMKNKDVKIDSLLDQNKYLINKVDVQSEQLDIQYNNIERLLKYGQDTNEVVNDMKIKIDNILCIVKDLLRVNYRSIYSVNKESRQIKFLIGYSFKKGDEYAYAFRYCQLAQFTASYNKLKKDMEKLGYEFYDYDIYGITPDNMLTMQKIYNDFDNIDKINKCTMRNINIRELVDLQNRVDNMIRTNKHEFFKSKIASNDKLRDYKDSLEAVMVEESMLNIKLNECIDKFISKKINENKNFQVMTLGRKLLDLLNL